MLATVADRQLQDARDWAVAQGLPLLATFNISRLPEDVAGEIRRLTGPDYSRFVSLLLTASAGRRLWQRATEHYPLQDHPVDRYSVEVTEHLISEHLGVEEFVRLYPGDSALSLHRLGELAGWHHPSPLGIAIHPGYGLWSAYRTLYAIAAGLPQIPALQSVSPCAQCSTRECVSSCPAKAVGWQQPFSMTVCARFRLLPDSPCANSCPARLSCPVGEEHGYRPKQMKFHYERSLTNLADIE